MAEAIYTPPEGGEIPSPAAPVSTEGTFVYNANHVGEMVSHLIEWFRKPRNIEWLTQIGSPIQSLEDVLWAIYGAFDVDTAVGEQLDYLGAIVGEARDNRTDDDYRTAVRTRILVNLSNGRIEDLIGILESLLPGNTGIHITEFYPAALRIEVLDAFTGASAETVARLLRQAKPAGVRLTFVPVDTDDTMIWSSPAGPDPTNGWGANWARLV